MVQPPDPFALNFDAIEIDPARTPAREAIESAMSLAAPVDDLLPISAAAPDFPSPGFYLLEDADGRFVVDREMGVVSLADDSLLERERGAVHGVRMRVVEQSGASYELDMQLRITGPVPQMVGAEEFALLAGLTQEITLTAPRIPALIVPGDDPDIVVEGPPPAFAPQSYAAEPAPIAWTRFAVAQGHIVRGPRLQPRRSFILAELTVASAAASLDFGGLPATFPSHLPWSL
jgi:hypothetical protein